MTKIEKAINVALFMADAYVRLALKKEALGDIEGRAEALTKSIEHLDRVDSLYRSI